MDLQTLENEALHLSRKERTQLIQRLVSSLDTPTQEELQSDWLQEARHRAQELDNGDVQTISGEEVMRKARALLK